MKQSRLMSLIEAITNVIVGYGVAVMTQMLIFPIFGLQTTLRQNLVMGGIFTIVSLFRSFALRRLFESIRIRDGFIAPSMPWRWTSACAARGNARH
ncbi:hypothetical protein [Marivita sp.]|uniref:DUF7220 family protein n=1 Tax=Marivita sp. TaxID=2003365 RepID=UPI0025C11CC7|nr:hypothetical protein [Marivita sp.]